MENYDYQPNSHKVKEERKNTSAEKRVEKVVNGTVKTKKKSGASKLANTLLSEDARNVKSYLVSDVLIPAVKKTLVDFVKDGVEMLVYGSTRRGDRRPIADKVSYHSRYDRRDDYPSESRSRMRFDYDDIILDSKGEAEMVLTRLDELIETYGHARVGDLYDLVGKSCDYTYNDYGWTNLSTAKTVYVRGEGYGLELPRALPIRR